MEKVENSIVRDCIDSSVDCEDGVLEPAEISRCLRRLKNELEKVVSCYNTANQEWYNIYIYCSSFFQLFGVRRYINTTLERRDYR